MESQPQNPEFRNNPENFHRCNSGTFLLTGSQGFDEPANRRSIKRPFAARLHKVRKMKAQTKI